MVEKLSKKPAREFSLQQGLPGHPDAITRLRFLEDQSFWERKKTAAQLVKGFVQLLPEGSEISWTVYDLDDSEWGLSEGGQPLNFLAKEKTRTLLKGMNNVLREFPLEETDLSFPMVAVASRVRYGDSVLHLAQMDFNGGKGESLDSIGAFVGRVLGPGKWAVLDSGDSYHAWGLDGLLSADQWQEFMDRVWDARDQRLGGAPGLRLEEAFIQASGERGFTALRVHPVPGFKGLPRLKMVLNVP